MILRQKIKRVSVSALKKKIDLNPDFLTSFLRPSEIRYCQAKRFPAEPAAARIAAKQACLSLFCIPISQHKKWFFDLEIRKKTNGQPFFKTSTRLNQKFKITKRQTLMLSLAHERAEAIAWVVLMDAVPRGSVRLLTHPRGTASGA